MKKETNPKILGAFVLIAIGLLVFTVIFFGANQLFRERHPYVMFFDSSLNGLQEGAAIKFRGINVGRVTNIKVILDHKTRDLFMPVYVELTPDSITEINLDEKAQQHDIMKEMIQHGLRARLALQNMITGMLYIELDFHENTPIKLVSKDDSHMEIPTIPSKTEELSGMLSTGQAALEAIREFMKSPRLNKSMEDFSQIMSRGKEAVKDIQQASISGKKAMDTGDIAIQDARKVIQNFNDIIDPIGIRVDTTLTDMEDTLTAIRVLSEYLSRHPESLLRGKLNTTRSR